MALTSIVSGHKFMTSAAVDIYDAKRRLIRCRALMDTCSTANLITEKLATALRLPKTKLSISVGGVNEMTTASKHVITATIKSIHDGFEKTLSFLTISRIANSIPSESMPRENIAIPANIRMADPDFYKSADADLLISAGPTLSMFSIGQIDLSSEGSDLFLQKTRLGWVLGGDVSNDRVPTNTCLLIDLQRDITKFWEVEEGTESKRWSSEELACEEHFQQNVKRDDQGRYIVALPFKQGQPVLGESRSRAIKQLNSLQRRFNSDKELQRQYQAGFEEYLKLGHVSEITEGNEEGFYSPHHPVIKSSSETTKVRMVFNASAKSSNGLSLNDALMVGPTIQDDIFTLILRFRMHNYVITADIEKMYRQFLVRSEDRKYQRMLWQGANGPITYELNRVTFGVASAPFLAIRCLQQLAHDEEDKFPNAARILKRDMYVDDLLTGASTIEEARMLRTEIVSLLDRGGLRLRQWASNDLQALEGLPEDQLSHTLLLDKEQPLKTLGIFWNSTEDAIKYSVNKIIIDTRITKRKILSEIAKIFDPLGLLGPIILFAKCLMQKLWLLKLDWDESVTPSIHTEWIMYCEELSAISTWSAARQVVSSEACTIQLHGFCDASEKGYGACIYLRSSDHDNKVSCRLLCSKSRVAPLKNVSIPRLELCAAQLLAKLYAHVYKTLNIQFEKTYLWTDSTITLHWIKTSPHTLKTFVANRVADIQEKTQSDDWRHVPSGDNPADQLSRGQTPRRFVENVLWRDGPDWLQGKESLWPRNPIEMPDEIPEQKRICCLVTTTDCELFERFSSFSKLRRIIAYCLRFKLENRNKDALDPQELQEAEAKIIRSVQATIFKQEIHDFKEHGQIANTSRLRALNPFVDENGVLRVGGRLKNAQLPYTQQHPAILPRSHHITALVIKHHHLQNYHSGIQTTLYAIRRQYWILDGRNQVRKVIRSCVACYRANPSTAEYTMGNLPAERVTQARPFSNVGVDYCGPFFIKEKKFRNRSKIKVYIAVFVCMAVKAVHLEVVSDLTTEGFLGALKRFISRRGKPQHIHSDNGTNFVGANNELRELYTLFNSTAHQQNTSTYLAEQGIQWKFIPPLSPNFGGLWESTVKSFKHHFKRVMYNELVTFEKFNTFTIEIEAILNSRPLYPLSTDPNDLLALSPGHFLIGDSLTSLPSPDHVATPANRLSQWEHLEKLRQDFWTRWHKEYLNELNIRAKWTKPQPPIKKDDIVLVKEDHTPPMQWALGRVIETHPGADGIVRVVTVKTRNSEFKRNIRRLAPLPSNEKDNT